MNMYQTLNHGQPSKSKTRKGSSKIVIDDINYIPHSIDPRDIIKSPMNKGSTNQKLDKSKTRSNYASKVVVNSK